MQNDIIKRPPPEPEARVVEKPTEAPKSEIVSQAPLPESTTPAVVDVIKAQEVPNDQSTPVSDGIKPDDKPKKKQKKDDKIVQKDQPKAPAGPGVAIGTAIFVCLVLVGLVVYAQIS